MSKTRKSYIGEDDTPLELDDQFFKQAVRGRPSMAPQERKQRVTMFLDREIVEYFKQDGKGWQTRVNDALARVVKRRKSRAA